MKPLKQMTTLDAQFLAGEEGVKEIRYILPFSREVVWNALVDGDTWALWLDGIDSVEWTSPEPFTVGTTRTVRGGKNVIEEVFFTWVDNEEMGFYFDKSNLPVKGFAEAYKLLDHSKGCELVWRFRIQGNLLLRFLGNAAMTRMGKTGFPRLEQVIQENPEKYAPS